MLQMAKFTWKKFFKQKKRFFKFSFESIFITLKIKKKKLFIKEEVNENEGQE